MCNREVAFFTSKIRSIKINTQKNQSKLTVDILKTKIREVISFLSAINIIIELTKHIYDLALPLMS